MAANPTPPATAAKSSFLLMPILSLPRLNHTIAALACVPVMCVASYAVGIGSDEVEPNSSLQGNFRILARA
jgi:hypothetical protein